MFIFARPTPLRRIFPPPVSVRQSLLVVHDFCDDVLSRVHKHIPLCNVCFALFSRRQGSIGEVSIVRRKSLSNSAHGPSPSFSKESSLVELNNVVRGRSTTGGGGEEGAERARGPRSIPSPPRGAALGTVRTKTVF